ncbi:sigma-54-dependent Fis family transcriptional regulator [Rhodococcus wratislaviensis]|uniref:sigma-54-dependent Fis family transcriptional regulator n=1 Tax=Rhodococcus wratislaviensis TaxID=44752 RepID=UPI0036574CD8
MTSEQSRNQSTERRPEIELAWRRATMSGLDPGMEVRETAISDIEVRSTLTIAAGPVLDKMVDELADTRFSILLADRTSRIVDRRVTSSAIGRALDRVLAVPGFQYLEEVSGTNSLATAFELRRPIAVTGEEHFLEALRCFCCYGAPIIHPVTHRLEGVIDVSGPVADATTLLGPFLMRAARDIEERLLEGSRVAEKQLLAEFQAHANQRRHAVVALGENLVLTNTAAVDLVKGADHVALRAIAADLPGSAAVECSLTLSSGAEVAVRARAVSGSHGGALFEITEDHTRSTRRPSGPRSTPVLSTPENQPTPTGLSRTILITGEPGTGRTTTARTMAGPGSLVIDAAAAIGDETRWFLDVRSALREDGTSIVIDNINALSPWLAAQLAGPVRVSRNQVVLTSAPLTELGNPHQALASLALTRHELQPLRTYPHKLAGVAKSVLAELLPASTVELAPSALQLLAAQPWPGNIRELRAVLEYAARGRERGMIIESDLPEIVRMNIQTTRTLTLMETAERDAIVAALRTSHGNRAAAAAELGIGRTTLYDRLRRYGIADVEPRTSVRNRNSSTVRDRQM